MITLNEKQAATLKSLFETDPDFRIFVSARLEHRAKLAMEEAQQLSDEQKLFSDAPAKVKTKKPSNRKPGSLKHKEAIRDALESFPKGVNVNELLQHLTEHKHQITKATLRTVLHGLKKNFDAKAEGKIQVRTEGNKPDTKYILA